MTFCVAIACHFSGLIFWQVNGDLATEVRSEQWED